MKIVSSVILLHERDANLIFEIQVPAAIIKTLTVITTMTTITTKTAH